MDGSPPPQPCEREYDGVGAQALTLLSVPVRSRSPVCVRCVSGVGVCERRSGLFDDRRYQDIILSVIYFEFCQQDPAVKLRCFARICGSFISIVLLF